MTGSPAAMASITAVGCASSREGNRNTSLNSSHAVTSVRGPRRWICGAQRLAATACCSNSNSGPPPTHTNLAAGRCAAISSTACSHDRQPLRARTTATVITTQAASGIRHARRRAARASALVPLAVATPLPITTARSRPAPVPHAARCAWLT